MSHHKKSFDSIVDQEEIKKMCQIKLLIYIQNLIRKNLAKKKLEKLKSEKVKNLYYLIIYFFI